jgi:TatD DNase family protein
LPAPPPPRAPVPLFDSHSHLTDERFATDLGDVLARAASCNVSEVFLPATEPADAERAAAIAARGAARSPEAPSPAGVGSTPRLFWSAGLHPHEARRWSPEVAAEVEERLGRGALAVGETGLDFHYDHSPRDLQRLAFETQAELARGRDLPLVVHSREADGETAAVLRASGLPPERVILHCFSAGRALLREAVEWGYYVSFSGMITFRNYETAEFLREVPPERLLVETDAPYLAPVPWRGHRNEPAYLSATVAVLAAARGLEPAEAGALTRANALRVYKLERLS